MEKEPTLPDSEPLSIADTLRVMDVATEIRKQQELVESQFHADELKAKLREKLLAAAEVTGEEITESQIEQAIDWYYLHLHKYKHPKWSFSLFLAHLYIRRGCFFALGFLLLFFAGIAYGVYWFVATFFQ